MVLFFGRSILLLRYEMEYLSCVVSLTGEEQCVFCAGDSLLFLRGHLMSIFTACCQFLSFFIFARKTQDCASLKSFPLPQCHSLFQVAMVGAFCLQVLPRRFPDHQYSETLSPECVLVTSHSGRHFLLSPHPP